MTRIIMADPLSDLYFRPTAAESDWLNFRDDFHRLYKVEDLSLAETMTRLKDQRQFAPT